jgi:hypothetical protein
MMEHAQPLPGVPALGRPARPLVWLNFAVFQIVWTGVILSVAQGMPWLGCLLVAAAIALHLRLAPSAKAELQLIAVVTLLGAAFECLRLTQADVIYPNGQLASWMPAYWLLALWALMATTLNLSLRWLHGRMALAAILGLVGGPLAFSAGVRLGAARFENETQALISLGVGWLVIMPLLVLLARRFDGFSGGRPT